MMQKAALLIGVATPSLGLIANVNDGVAMVQQTVVSATHEAESHPRLDAPDSMQAFIERVQDMSDDPSSLSPMMKQVMHTPQIMSDLRNVLTSSLKWARKNPVTADGVPHEAELTGYKHMKKMQSDLEDLHASGGTASLLQKMELALEDPTLKTRVPHELRKFYQDPEMRAKMAEVMFQGVRQGQKVWARSPAVQRNLALYSKGGAQDSFLKTGNDKKMRSAIMNFTLPKFHDIIRTAEARSLLQVGGPPGDPRGWDVGDLDTQNLASGMVRQRFSNLLMGTGRAGCPYSDFFGIVLRIAIHTAYGSEGFQVFVSPILHIHLMPMPPENPSMWKYGVGTMPFGTAFEFKFPDNYLGKGVGVDYVGAGVGFPGDNGDASVSLEMLKAKGVAAVSTLIMLSSSPAAQGSRMLFSTGSGLKFGLPYAGSLEGWARWGFIEPTKGPRFLFDVAPNLNLWTPPFYIGRSRFVTKAVNFISFEFSQEGKFMNLLSSFLMDSAPHDHMIAGIETEEAMACWGYAKESAAPPPVRRRQATQAEICSHMDETTCGNSNLCKWQIIPEKKAEPKEKGKLDGECKERTKDAVMSGSTGGTVTYSENLKIPEPPVVDDLAHIANADGIHEAKDLIDGAALRKWLVSHGEGRLTDDEVMELFKDDKFKALTKDDFKTDKKKATYRNDDGEDEYDIYSLLPTIKSKTMA